MLPFSVFLRGKRPHYYVAFKNEETGRYLPAISTKKTKKSDAERQAWVWFREGIPSKGDLKVLSLRDTVRRSELTQADAEFIISELKRRGLILSCVFPGAPDAVRFTDYLEEFWDWDRSPYIREKLRAEHSIHKIYVRGMLYNVRKYWLPFFSTELLGELTPKDIERLADHLSVIKSAKDQPLSNIRKNNIMAAGTIPLRWAYRKEKIAQDITRSLVHFSGKFKERIILTPEMAASVFSQNWEDERCKIANITAMVTGLRAGELQGLRTEDIGEDCLFIRHSWNPTDKLKTTKNNEGRVVEVPFPSVLNSLRYVASLNPHGASNESYVFWAGLYADKPMEQRLFIRALRHKLKALGIEAKDFTFHGWRHFFTTYMRNKIEDKLLQSQTGHKTISMLERYSAHQRTKDRDKIREAQREVFSSLLPLT